MSIRLKVGKQGLYNTSFTAVNLRVGPNTKGVLSMFGEYPSLQFVSSVFLPTVEGLAHSV